MAETWNGEENVYMSDTVMSRIRYSQDVLITDWYTQLEASGFPRFHWSIFEEINLDKQRGDHPVLVYDGSAQTVLPVLEEWMEIPSISAEEIQNRFRQSESCCLEWIHGSQITKKCLIDQTEHSQTYELVMNVFAQTGYIRRNDSYREYGAWIRLNLYDADGDCTGEIVCYTPELLAIDGQMYRAVEKLDFDCFDEISDDRKQKN